VTLVTLVTLSMRTVSKSLVSAQLRALLEDIDQEVPGHASVAVHPPG